MTLHLAFCDPAVPICRCGACDRTILPTRREHESGRRLYCSDCRAARVELLLRQRRGTESRASGPPAGEAIPAVSSLMDLPAAVSRLPLAGSF